MQKILEAWTLPLVEEELTDFPEETIQKIVQDRFQQEAFHPFDLREPLLRVRFMRASQESYLLLTIHHLITDGWSMNLFVDDLRHSYASRINDREPVWESAPENYRDFACWQKELPETPFYPQMKEYWKNYLKGDLPILTLSPFHQHPLNPSDEGASVSMDIPERTLKKLDHFNIREKSTVAITLMAAFHSLMYLYSGRIVF